MAQKAIIYGDAGAGADNYAVTGFSEQVAGSGSVTFSNLKGTPKAIWVSLIDTNGLDACWTNVNPTTGEIDNTNLFMTYSTKAGTPSAWAAMGSSFSFVVNGNTMQTNPFLSATASRQIMMYTY